MGQISLLVGYDLLFKGPLIIPKIFPITFLTITIYRLSIDMVFIEVDVGGEIQGLLFKTNYNTQHLFAQCMQILINMFVYFMWA